MAIIEYINLTECLSSDGYPERPDGWFLKWVDTGQVFHRVDGVWIDWGLGFSFAPPTKSGSVITDIHGQASIIFGTPFINNDYTVALTCGDPGVPVVAYLVSKEIDGHGFNIETRDPRSHMTVEDVTVTWLATRNYNT